MAKDDFCFTYYDGDAARDTTHMNRLERGAYHDIIISQRKFGHLTLDQIKKILGKDFVECWPAIELIMKVADGKFFIEWLEKSELKAKAHAKKQSENRKGKTKINQTLTKQEPKDNQTKPLEDGDGNGYVIEYKEKESEKFESEISLEEVDEELVEVTQWTNDVLVGNDVVFMNMVRKESVNLNGQLIKLARDHLGLCSRYKWHKNFTTQQAFRNSLLNHVRENVEKASKSKPQKGISKDDLDEFRKI